MEDSVQNDINMISSKIEQRKQDEEWNMVDQIVDAELRVIDKLETSNLSQDYNQEKSDQTINFGYDEDNQTVDAGTEIPEVDLSGIGP